MNRRHFLQLTACIPALATPASATRSMIEYWYIPPSPLLDQGGTGRHFYGFLGDSSIKVWGDAMPRYLGLRKQLFDRYEAQRNACGAPSSCLRVVIETGPADILGAEIRERSVVRSLEALAQHCAEQRS